MTAPPRIVSLLPAATEIACALGLADRLVGRSHECDEPPAVAALPSLTRARIDAAASSREIHEQVGKALGAGAGSACGTATSAALFDLDVAALAALRPDLVLTQAACDVCAIALADVETAVRASGAAARIVALSPASLSDVWRDVLAVAEVTGTLPRGREVVARLRARCASVASRAGVLTRASAAARPRVAVIEWLDPPMAAGNWVPELVRLAGGDAVDGRPGAHSHWISWDDVAASDPDVVILAPCGFTLDRILAEARVDDVRRRLAPLRATRTGRLWAVDGHHLLNRPGPRLVDSLEVLATVFHKGAFAFPAGARYAARIDGG